MAHYPNVADLERMHGLSWHELAQSEPQLGELLWEARQTAVICRNWYDVYEQFAPFRRSLAWLVGFEGKHRDDPLLGSLGAYEVAYWKLYDAVARLVLRSPRKASPLVIRLERTELAEPRRDDRADTWFFPI
jgi:hypothetical protein